MTCSPARPPELFDSSLLQYSPSIIERRFLTGWWTRGQVPADSFTVSNWAGLIIPDKIHFQGNEVEITYGGRYWDSDNCRRSLPKVVISVQYICHGGRLMMFTSVQYGNDKTEQLYVGHNGSEFYWRTPLEKPDAENGDPCSIEIKAGINPAQADKINIKHFADWLLALITAKPDAISGQQEFAWVELLANYLKSDFRWAPCTGCLFPNENYSIPGTIDATGWNFKLAELLLKNVKAIGEVILLGSVPQEIAIPLCPAGAYLELKMPELDLTAHMRGYDTCDGVLDSVYSFPVDLIGGLNWQSCFNFKGEENWPKGDDPRWEDICPAGTTTRCILTIDFSRLPGTADRTPKPVYQYQANSFALCGNKSIQENGFSPGYWPRTNNSYTRNSVIVASTWKTVTWREWTCYIAQGYDGPREVEGCTTLYTNEQRILFTEEVLEGNAYARVQELWRANGYGQGWTCDSQFNSGGGGGGGNPPPPNQEPERQPDKGDCFFEATYIYQIKLTTILGTIHYEVNKPIRIKVPKGTKSLGPVSATMSGASLTITSPIGGSVNVDLNSVFAYFSALGNAIASAIPVSGGIRNPRILCEK